ncbi:hypothetical protein BV898_00327 [Hypsibius exemplaris]|uniref:Receptor ligand binding region domain-containing protein n=1 Tax=Hypsibius exemplaris TaxID=2072580 RepID=A0A1W0XFN4_HYPEX|nr:hypothetical protein BV898_00327 [Hypsibius exemplaris]
MWLWAVCTEGSAFIFSLDSPGPPPLHFRSLHLGNYPATGYMAIQPIFNYSLSVARTRYPETFAGYVYDATSSKTNTPAGPDVVQMSVDHMMDLYVERTRLRADTLTTLLIPTLTPDVAVVGDFAREMDLLMISCTTMHQTFSDKVRFPNFNFFGLAYTEPYGRALASVLAFNNWTSIVVMKDLMSRSLQALRSSEICRGPADHLKSLRATVQSKEITVDSSLEDFRRGLTMASNFSRIVLSCTLGGQQRQMLADAHALGMTNGDYVFIHLYNVEVPNDAPMTWYRNDSLDQVVRSVISNLLIIRSPLMPWDIVRNVSTKVWMEREALFGKNLPVPSFQNNEFEISCYEAVQVAALVINETRSHPKALSGRFLAQRMLNRTFQLPERDVTMTARGSQVSRINVLQYDIEEETLHRLYFYDVEASALKLSSGNYWVKFSAILDRPKCGLYGQLCLTESGATVTFSVSVTFCLILILGIAVGTRYFIVQRQLGADRWWLIVEADFIGGEGISLSNIYANFHQ